MIEIPLSRVMPLYGGTLTSIEKGLMLDTDPRHCAFSAEVDIPLNEIAGEPKEIIVAATVESGYIGIGLLRHDGKAWVQHVATKNPNARVTLEISMDSTCAKLVFNNIRADEKPTRIRIESIRVLTADEDHLRSALEAEECGDTDAAIAHYTAVLDKEPGNVSAIAGLGRLRYSDPHQPVLDEIRRSVPADAIFQVMIEIRNPCNYRCFYCVSAGRNNTPVQRFDLDRIEQVTVKLVPK